MTSCNNLAAMTLKIIGIAVYNVNIPVREGIRK
jgi:hypothetical protein